MSFWKNSLSLLPCVLLLLAGCQRQPDAVVTSAPLPINKFDDPVIVRIYDLADRRQGDSLLPYLSDSSDTYRMEAAMAFGSVQDSAARPALERLLQDGHDEVVAAAAWALGQLGDTASATPLLAALRQAEGKTMDPIGVALGKCGSATQLGMAIADVDSGKLAAMGRHAVTQAIYRGGVRGQVPPTAQAFAFQGLEDQDMEVRTWSAAFLSRVAAAGPVKEPQTLLKGMAANDNKEVRQLLVREFARCADTACTAALRRIAADPKEWEMTRANAFRAAGAVHPLQQTAIAALKDISPNVGVAAAEYLDARLDTTPAAALAIAKGAVNWRARAIVLRTAMRLAMKKGKQPDRVAVRACIDSLSVTAAPYERAILSLALGEDPANHDTLMATALTLKPIVAIYALEAYLTYHARDYKPDPKVVANLAKAMRTGDEGLVAMSAEHIAAAPPAFGKLVAKAHFLDSALAKLTEPADIEAHNAVLKAMTAADGKPREPKKLPFAHPIDWKLVQRIPTGQTAVLETSKGQITFRLLVEQAPGTVANFVKLVQDGFYNKKLIHRVVPAFVAQGGCPRGDGWGSTPETIRSEWPDLHYGSGTVGMASAGKDTESCQWFITHCEVPHLDGRYTIFAEVTQGMEVVAALEIGDEIVSISLPDLD